MGKALYIAEKPSVAREFAKALGIASNGRDGYIEDRDTIVTWCVGHLVTMSYPEVYEQAMKYWRMDTLPFLPAEYKYEVIDSAKGQFAVVKRLLTRDDVDRIYICTDSGREGEYIYRLVDMMAGVKDKERRRVWIDSQTEDEIKKGIREAKDWAEYDNLAASAFLRAKEDYLMGINFSRAMTLKYGPSIAGFLKENRAVLSMGRVMTCVLGMVVRREREIRGFVKIPFYRVFADFEKDGTALHTEFKAVPGSAFFGSPVLYKENGFKKKEDAEVFIDKLKAAALSGETAVISGLQRKQEKKNPPLLYNLAELQNDCSKSFHISPDETLKYVQQLYEKKLVTYPRTDARVLSSAIAKEIVKNITGLKNHPSVADFAAEVLENGSYKGIAKTRYVDDSQITDHYAIIPTGQGESALRGMDRTACGIYDLIARRFLSVFYPPAIYKKASAELSFSGECFTASAKKLVDPGYQRLFKDMSRENEEEGGELLFSEIKKGSRLSPAGFSIKEGETSPPKKYTSGSMILAMENAGQLIEDEELREQIKSCGIGTSATRAEILKKLVNIKYIALNKKTQVISPTLLGEMVFETVSISLRQLLNPELTASWEKGLSYVAAGQISDCEYMEKLEGFVRRRTENVKTMPVPYELGQRFGELKGIYQTRQEYTAQKTTKAVKRQREKKA